MRNRRSQWKAFWVLREFLDFQFTRSARGIRFLGDFSSFYGFFIKFILKVFRERPENHNFEELGFNFTIFWMFSVFLAFHFKFEILLQPLFVFSGSPHVFLKKSQKLILQDPRKLFFKVRDVFEAFMYYQRNVSLKMYKNQLQWLTE